MYEYKLTKSGVSAFLEAVLSDAMDGDTYNPMQITIGSRTITADLFSEVYEALEELLKTNLEIIEEEATC